MCLSKHWLENQKKEQERNKSFKNYLASHTYMNKKKMADLGGWDI